jgi:hypothetical protein
MNEFMASTGMAVSVEDSGCDGATPKITINDSVYWVPRPSLNALREFFQHERDTALGRWRWPENPDYVVYAQDYGVQVLDELEGGGNILGIWNREDLASVPYRPLESPLARAADAYFAAHPEPKPWLAAVEGEAWVITVESGQFPALFQAGRFGDAGGTWDMDQITAAHRIWPES